MTEIWKDIPNYEGRYQASSAGRVRSLPRLTYRGKTPVRRKGKVLRPGLTPKGYMLVHLYTNGSKKRFYVHQLTALAFLSNPKHLKELCHLDGNKKNNRPSNLKWCTRHWNVNYGNRSKRAGISSGYGVILCKGKHRFKFPTMTASARWLIKMGYSKLKNPKHMVTTISNCARHKKNFNHAYGFTVELIRRPKEIWHDIPGYKGLYQASDRGRIRRKAHYVYIKRYMPSRVLKPRTDKDGYYRVGLYRHRYQNMRRVNQLVAKAFLPNPKGLPVVNHRNEDRKDNRPENLEWCTTNYNNQYGNRQKRIINYYGHSLKLIRDGHEFRFPTIISAVRWLKAKHHMACSVHGLRNNMRLCLRHKYGYNSVYGYKPKFLDDKWVELSIGTIDA